MNYENLIQLATEENIEIYEIKLPKRIKGLYADNIIAISKQLSTSSEKACVLAEELGHHYTTVGNILDQSKTENRKQEYKARRWAVKKLIRVEQFIDAFNAGVTNKAELAEFLDVTEGFIDTALDHFKAIYGFSHSIGEYTIYFEPLFIYKNL